jgi:TonB-linked SusC/RagA family outer membrane protein
MRVLLKEQSVSLRASTAALMARGIIFKRHTPPVAGDFARRPLSRIARHGAPIAIRTVLLIAFSSAIPAVHAAAQSASSTTARGSDPTTGPVIGAPDIAIELSTDQQVPVDALPASLRTRITLKVSHVPIEVALKEIEAKMGTSIAYSRDAIPGDRRVSLDLENGSLIDALRQALTGTHLDLRISSTGRAVLVPSAETETSRALQLGSIAGLVSDSTTHQPIVGAIVRVNDLRRSAVTNEKGHYQIFGLTPGRYTLTSQRIGFIPSTNSVEVVAEGNSRLDFNLVAAPTRLNEILVTGSGPHRRLELGTSVATIDVDSVSSVAPVSSITDLLTSRAPGVEVVENSGVTGGGESIRIRGRGSLVLQGDPVVIVDGIRQNNSPGGNSSLYGGVTTFTPSPSRLNDLDFNDIQTIEVLKGPSAATEYGTDAANGVIVITTKHGRGGKPQLTATAEHGGSGLPNKFSDYYTNWGHSTDGTNTPVYCPLVPALFGDGFGTTVGTCVVDSTTRFNPLNSFRYTVFGSGLRDRYNLQVRGGSTALNYFLAAGLTNETGFIQLPQVFRPIAANLQFPDSIFQPNQDRQRSLVANVSLSLGTTADVSVNTAYLATDQSTADVSALYAGAIAFHPLRDSADLFGYSEPFYSPLFAMGRLASQDMHRWTGGLTANWSPAPWLTTRAIIGLDHGAQQTQNQVLPQAAEYAGYGVNQGQLAVQNATLDVYSADLRASVTTVISPTLRSMTSVGGQFVKTISQGISATARGLSQTNFTIDGAVGPLIQQTGTQAATLGGYIDEQLSLAERVFFSAALRADAGSGFGSDYNSALYPKASVSWLVAQHGENSVRLRGAYGESGVQPPPGAALQIYTPQVGWLNGSATSILLLNTPGSPGLRPERSREFEGGADFAWWANRLTAEFTGYMKTTSDALVNQNLGLTFGNAVFYENIGEVRNSGIEAGITATPARNSFVTWNVNLSGSINHNKLLTLGAGVLPQSVGSAQRQVPGYPLYGYWGLPMSYKDANGDGIIESNEVHVGDKLAYMGPSLPTKTLTFGTDLSTRESRVRVGALFDYKTGYRVLNEAAFEGNVIFENQRGNNDPTAPLWEQARSVAAVTGYGITPPSLFFEDGTFLRFRELSLSYMLPRSFSEAVRVSDLTIMAAVRNLALWTRYTGADPEVSNADSPFGNGNVRLDRSSNVFTVNNDIRQDEGAVPLARSWVLRLTARF